MERLRQGPEGTYHHTEFISLGRGTDVRPTNLRPLSLDCTHTLFFANFSAGSRAFVHLLVPGDLVRGKLLSLPQARCLPWPRCHRPLCLNADR